MHLSLAGRQNHKLPVGITRIFFGLPPCMESTRRPTWTLVRRALLDGRMRARIDEQIAQQKQLSRRLFIPSHSAGAARDGMWLSETEESASKGRGERAPPLSRPLSFWGDASENQTRRFELYSMDALLEHVLFAYFWDNRSWELVSPLRFGGNGEHPDD